MEFGPFFKEYEMLVQQIDHAVEKIKNDYPTNVTCHLGCSDCCYALFDLSLVEALYLKKCFDARFEGGGRDEIFTRANKADRIVHRLKRQAFREHEAGKPDDEIIDFMAKQRVRCPILDEQDRCLLYDVRPITCRLYGLPIEIGGYAHTCGKTGFSRGVSYQTVKVDRIHKRLSEISFALSQSINSRYAKLSEMIVPLSMALLTDYTEEFMGVIHPSEREDAR